MAHLGTAALRDFNPALRLQRVRLGPSGDVPVNDRITTESGRPCVTMCHFRKQPALGDQSGDTPTPTARTSNASHQTRGAKRPLTASSLSELINQRSRRSIHIVGWMLSAIIVNPSHHLFGAFSTRHVALWLGSVLIECSYIAKNPGSPGSYLNVLTRANFKPRATRDISLSQHGLLLRGHLDRLKQKQARRKQGSPVKLHAAPLGSI